MNTIICTVGTSTIEKMKSEFKPWSPQDRNDIYHPKLNETDFFNACLHFHRQKTKGERLLSTYQLDIENIYESKVIKGRHFIDWPQGDIWRILPAEIASTIQIIRKFSASEDEVSVQLLVPDTGEAWLSSKVIKTILENVGFNVTNRVIEGFQMDNIDKLKNEGIQNFVRSLNSIIPKQNHKNDLVFNITGGYKNFIPLITHISSFYQQDMYYAFEELVGRSYGESIVTIPTIPTFNKVLADKNDVVLDIINDFVNTGYSSIREANLELEDIIISRFEGLDDAVNSYKDFIISFFDFNENTNRVELTVVGKTYLELLNNIA